MAEISKSTSRMDLWPTLKRKLGEAKLRKKQKKANPFASQGLEKFALLMSELQAKSSLVDKTGNSVSAVRYLSRSAQEWTASTIARTASRRKDTSPKASSEILLLQHSQSKETTSEVEIVDFSRSFSFPDPDHRFDFDVVGDLQRELDPDAETVEVKRDSVWEPSPPLEEAGCSGTAKTTGLPAQSARLIRNGRLLLLEKGWARSPNSAVALLVALSACVVARVAKIGNSFFELLTIDLVFRLQKGKLYADFLQSLVTRHIVPHLSIRVRRGLTLLPLVTSNKPSLEIEPPPQQSEIEPEPSFTFPVVPESSSLEFPVSPQLRIDNLEPTRTPSPTRRLVRKLSSKLKAKMSKSPTPESPDSSRSSCTSPRRSSKFSFSRRDKEKELSSSSDGWPDDEVFADTASSSSSSKRRCMLKKKCSFRKEKTPELATTIRRSPLGRNSSLEATSSAEIPASLLESKTPSSSATANFDLWLILGLLVTLLFLIVSRLSAIVATSLFLLLLSNAYKESSKFRVPPRRDLTRALPRSHGRVDSPSREEPLCS